MQVSDVTNGSLDSRSVTIDVADAPVTTTATAVQAFEHVPFTGEVATFSDGNPYAPLSDFPLANVTIVWGHGATTGADQITQPNGVGTPFHVFGTHTYGEEGMVATIQVTVKDIDGAVSNTTSSTLTVTPVPVATGVVANAVDGTYGIGAVISITVTFDHPMTVDTSSGVPTLVLNSGGVANFSSAAPSGALIFRYVVAAGDGTAKRDYLGRDALKLNGGVIRLAPAAGGFNTDQCSVFSVQRTILLNTEH